MRQSLFQKTGGWNRCSAADGRSRDHGGELAYLRHPQLWQIERFAGSHSEQFLIERAFWRQQGDFPVIAHDRHAAAGRDQKEIRGLTIEIRPYEGTGVDFLIHFELRNHQRIENPHGFGKFIDLAGLAGGEVGRFEAASVVFPLRLAAGVGGGGVSLHRCFGKAFEPGKKLGADLIEDGGFHRRTERLAWQPEGRKIRRMLTVYVYQKCSTCRDALKWLAARGIHYQEKAIRETPPTVAELKVALKEYGGNLRSIFNTSGLDYRALGLKDRLPGMAETEALELLAKNGNLVKRPFLTGDGKVLVGFKEADWEKTLR